MPKAVQTGDEDRKAREVREMFGAIAGRYDLLNHLLSGGIDRRWRRSCATEVLRRIGRTDSRILDVGCGTGDLSLAFGDATWVAGCDFCQPMLRIGRDKIVTAGRTRQVAFLAADALKLPFRDNSFDAVVSAFVLRNLASIEQGLSEMRRVLRSGGVLCILDFAMPTTPAISALYRFYFLRVLPRIGRLISGVDGAYSYLPESVGGFPRPDELRVQIQRAGFDEVQYRLLTGGIAVLLLGTAVHAAGAHPRA